MVVLATLIGACSTSHGVTGADAAVPVIDACSCYPDSTPPILSDSGVVDAYVPPSACGIQDARTIVCAPGACDGPPTYFWDGSRCFPIGCGECEGADCDNGFGALAECEAAHQLCDAALCRASGGDWLSAPLYCGHHICGEPGLAICEVPTPACNCGASSAFEPGIGCVVSESCPPPDPTLSPEGLCTSTGGTWANTCCPSTCGVPCSAECLAPACTCGALQIWDEDVGCIDSSTCMERNQGEVCTVDTRCHDGLICCQHCGGAGCAPDATCEWPTCDADPNIDQCGNNLLAP